MTPAQRSLQQNGVVNPYFKTMLLLVAVKKVPIVSLKAIVMNSRSTKEFEAFSNVSVFSVHTENGSFLKRSSFQMYAF